jgi:hypothetical protein
MKYKTVEETSFVDIYRFNATVLKVLLIGGFFFDTLNYLAKVFKVMRLPNEFFNLASQLSSEQMYTLQVELNGVNKTNLKRIEEILSDYGLDVTTLSNKQIRGFAKFVRNF